MKALVKQNNNDKKNCLGRAMALHLTTAPSFGEKTKHLLST